MRIVIFPRITLAISLVIIMTAFTICIRAKTRGTSLHLKQLSLFLLSTVLCGVFIYLCVVGLGLWYIDRCYTSLPGRAIERRTVKASLPFLFETEVCKQDIPAEYRDRRLSADGLTIYRYSYLLPVFSFHALYDANDVLIEKIPTYE